MVGDFRLSFFYTQTLEYVMREMTHVAGGFYSASDADSEGVEGKFFVWTVPEIEAALKPKGGI